MNNNNNTSLCYKFILYTSFSYSNHLFNHCLPQEPNRMLLSFSISKVYEISYELAWFSWLFLYFRFSNRRQQQALKTRIIIGESKKTFLVAGWIHLFVLLLACWLLTWAILLNRIQKFTISRHLILFSLLQVYLS